MAEMWAVARRGPTGYPIEMRRIEVEATIRNERGAIEGYIVGDKVYHPADVVGVAIVEPPTHRAHACAHLAELDCYAVLGDHRAAALARWHEAHPLGPQTPEEYAEEAALRAGFARRTA